MGKTTLKGQQSIFICQCILILLAFWGSPSLPGQPIILDDNFHEQSILKNVDIFEDKSNRLIFQDILTPEIQKQFKPNQRRAQDFSSTRSIFWIRFQLKNSLKNSSNAILEIGQPRSPFDTFFKQDKAGKWTSTRFSKLKIGNVQKCLKLPLPNNQTRQFYIKIHGDGGPLLIPLNLYENTAFHNYNRKVMLGIGIYLGVIILVWLASLIMAIKLRNFTYFTYCLFIMCYMLFQSRALGFDALFLSRGPWHLFGIGLSVFTLHVFSRRFLDIKRLPWLSRLSLVLMIFSVIWMCCLPSRELVHIWSFLKVVPILLLGTSVLFIWAAWKRYQQGYQPALIYLFSWFPLLIGLGIHVCVIEGFLPYSGFWIQAVQFGALFQIVIGWLALVEMARKKQKDAQDKILQMEKDESHRLEKLVNERTKELDQELNVTRRLYQAAWERVYGDLLGDSPAIIEVRRQIELFASKMTPVFLSGPSGAGQEAIARAIHMASPQREKSFILINCITKTATAKIDPDSQQCCSKNTIDLADGGTLFIDEFHQIDQESQLNLLTILDSPEPKTRVIIFMPTDILSEGGVKEKISPLLMKLLQQNRFTIPSLHERQEDIPILIKHFVEEYARHLGKFVKGVSEDSITRAIEYDWPRNIRQLRQVVEQAVTTSSDALIEITEEALYGGEYLDRYQLLNKIGEGGMGEVWLAQHQLLARPVALKLIRTESDTSIEDRQKAFTRFEREAKMTAKLKSPNTIRLFDYGVTDKGEFYFIMELLRGMTLHKMVEEYGPLSPARTVMLLMQLCRSLMEAHQIGLVHRDIKPHNLFICKMGSEYDFLKVLDFGIVKPHENLEQLSDDEKQEIMGSIYTIAPEMIRNPDQATLQSDIYAIGCTAYWMLTGKFLFYRETISAMAWEHLHSSPTPPSSASPNSIPQELDQIILDCLNKDPAKRPASAKILWQQLDDFAQNNRWTQDQAIEWWDKNAAMLIEDDDKLGTQDLKDHYEELNNQKSNEPRTFIRSTKPQFKYSISSWDRALEEDNSSSNCK